MFQLPPATAINQPLYKKAVFEKFNLKAVERDRFDTDISKMALVARISPATVPALAEGQDIKGFYVLQVALKRKDYDSKHASKVDTSEVHFRPPIRGTNAVLHLPHQTTAVCMDADR